MDDEKLMALKKAYADIILDTAKEATARVMASEKKAVRLQREIDYAKAEAVRMLVRLKQTYDCKVGEVEMKTLSQQGKIDELEAQLQEAEEIVSDLRGELSAVHDQLERMRKRRALDRRNLELGTSDSGKVSPDVQCSQEMITSKANLQAEGVVTNDEKCNSNEENEGGKCDIATDRHNLELGTSDSGKVSPDVQCFQGMITSKANLLEKVVVTNEEKCNSNGAHEGSKCDIAPDRQNLEVGTSDRGEASQDIQRVPDTIPSEVNVQAEAAVTNDEKCSSDEAYEGSKCHTAPDSLKDDNYVHNRDFASVTLRSKESELYRNGCTQRIRAFERNEEFPRCGQDDDAKQAKLIEAKNGDDKGITVTSTPKCDDINKVEKNLVGKKRLPDESNREKEELEAEKRWQRRKRRATKLPFMYINSSTSPSNVDNKGITGDSAQISDDITLEVAASLSNLKSKPSDTSDQKETSNDLEKADLTSNECLALKSLELLAGRTDVENERLPYERRRKRKKVVETGEVPRKERKIRATKLPLLYIEMSQVSGSSCSSTTPSSSNNKGLTDNSPKVSEDKTPEVMASLSTPKAPSYTTEMSSQSASDIVTKSDVQLNRTGSAQKETNDTTCTMVTKSDVQLNRTGSVQKETNDTTCTQQTDLTRNKCLSAESLEVLACKTDVEKDHSDSKASNLDDVVASQPVSNKFLKYTFQRKHKNETLSTSERNSQNGSVEGNTRETKTGYQQPSLMTASSRDSRRLALVAHQLVSLSEKKHYP